MADKNNIPQFVNSDSFMADKNYVKWLSDLKKRFHIAQLKAAGGSSKRISSTNVERPL